MGEGGGACEGREGRDLLRVGEEVGEICEMLCSVVTQNSRELLRREPDFLNYLLLSVNRNTHL